MIRGGCGSDEKGSVILTVKSYVATLIELGHQSTYLYYLKFGSCPLPPVLSLLK